MNTVPPASGEPPRSGAEFFDALFESLPVRNTGRFGMPGDPWNLLFIATQAQLDSALAAAGWTKIALGLLRPFAEGFLQAFRGEFLTRFPPMNTYRLLGAPQDRNWAQTVIPIEKRHHFRLWRLPYRDKKGRTYWWGSANFDLSVRWRDFSHVPDPDTVMEREYIATSLQGSPWVESISRRRSSRIPAEGENDKGYAFRTDGSVLLVFLRDA